MNGIDGLFTLLATPAAGTTEGGTDVRFDVDHPILRGHFPGRPIVPGVCLVHIAAVIASAMHGRPLRVVRARSIKFLAPVEPDRTPVVRFNVSLSAREDGVRAEVRALAGDTLVLKLNAELAPDGD